MRHRKLGRRLGRSSSHRKAMLKNLASSLFLSERDADGEENAPKVKGRVITTLHKAKEVRPLVEKCITLAKNSLKHVEAAEQFATSADRNTGEWKEWRQSPKWQEWNQAIAPAVAARRRAIQLLGDKTAVSILFEEVAPRFVDRPGGYTRVLHLAGRRLGDAGFRALIEFVGVHDRIVERSEKPSFGDSPADQDAVSDDDHDALTDDQLLADDDAATDDAASGENATEEVASDAEEPSDAKDA